MDKKVLLYFTFLEITMKIYILRFVQDFKDESWVKFNNSESFFVNIFVCYIILLLYFGKNDEFTM